MNYKKAAFMVWVTFILILPSMSYAKLKKIQKPKVNIIRNCQPENNHCYKGELISVEQGAVLYARPDIKSKKSIQSDETKATAVDSQRQIYPQLIKTIDLEFYILKRKYNYPTSETWSILHNGQKSEMEANLLTDTEYHITWADKKFKIAQNAAPTIPNSDITWTKIKTFAGKENWILDGLGIVRLDPLEDTQISELKKVYARFQKQTFLTLPEFISLSARPNYSEKIGAVHEIWKAGDSKYDKFSYGIITLGGPEATDPKFFFKFNSCSELTRDLRSQFPYQTVGVEPLLVRFNKYFIEHMNSPLTNTFNETCLELVDNNSFVCPSSNNFYQKVIAKVGPLVSIENGNMSSGGCGPVYTRIKADTYDLRTKSLAKISDFFDEDDILRQLKKDPYILNLLKKSRMPDTLSKAEEEFALSASTIYDHKIRDGRIRVRWASAPDSCGMCLNSYEWIGLDLLPKPQFLEEFNKLDPKNEMFLSM